MKILGGISRGALGLAVAACLCASVPAQAWERGPGHGVHVFPVPVPLPLPLPPRPVCGYGRHIEVLRDAWGRVVGERCVPDFYRRY